MHYCGFLFKTTVEVLDLLVWVVRDTYEFEKITCASRMSFSNPCAFHAGSVYEEKFVTPCFTPDSIPTCNLCYVVNHNFDSCPRYVRLKAEIETIIETAFNSMEHMMGEMFNQLLRLGKKRNECDFDGEEHMSEDTPLGGHVRRLQQKCHGLV